MRKFFCVAALALATLGINNQLQACGGYGSHCYKPAVKFIPQFKTPGFPAPIGGAPAGSAAIIPGGNVAPAPAPLAPAAPGAPAGPIANPAPAPLGGPVAGGNGTAVPFVAGRPQGNPGVPGGNGTAVPFVSRPNGPIGGGNNTASPQFVRPSGPAVGGGNTTVTPFIAPAGGGNNTASPNLVGNPVNNGNQTRIPAFAPNRRR